MEHGRRGEHRSRVRVPVQGVLLLSPASLPNAQAVPGRLHDLSCCGVGAIIESLVPVGTAVRVRIDLGPGRHIEVRGLVARCDKSAEDCSVGVRFIEPPLDLRVTVSSLTAPAVRGPLPPHLQSLLAPLAELRHSA